MHKNTNISRDGQVLPCPCLRAPMIIMVTTCEFNISREGQVPPCPCLRAPMIMMVTTCEFNISREGQVPPCPCLRAPMIMMVTTYELVHYKLLKYLGWSTAHNVQHNTTIDWRKYSTAAKPLSMHREPVQTGAEILPWFEQDRPRSVTQ